MYRFLPRLIDLVLMSRSTRGVGEIGLAGMAAALSSAVYHATGKRVRDLPVTTEKQL